MRTSDIYLLSLTTWAPLQFAKGERINGEGFCPFVFRRFVEPGRIYLLTLILSSAPRRRRGKAEVVLQCACAHVEDPKTSSGAQGENRV